MGQPPTHLHTNLPRLPPSPLPPLVAEEKLPVQALVAGGLWGSSVQLPECGDLLSILGCRARQGRLTHKVLCEVRRVQGKSHMSETLTHCGISLSSFQRKMQYNWLYIDFRSCLCLMEVAQSKLKSINELGMCKYPQTSTNLALTVVTFLHFFYLLLH